MYFALPIMKCYCRGNDQEGSIVVFGLCKMSQQSNGLYGLAKTHFISKNTIDSLAIQIIKPSKTFDLIGLELSFEVLWCLHKG